ncbi:MAG: calcium-binding protein, partial [Acetobacteraceae bacterium]|nr:calcium-binding protein [Acetobacteraceae bacterium]
DLIYGGTENDSVLGGNGDDRVFGEAGSDTVLGGHGNDVIDGGADADRLDGGVGNDNLIGGTGNDQFIFNTALSATNVDTIQGYNVADDTILLDDAIFGGVGAAGTSLAASAFAIGTAATTTGHRIIYNATTGALLYDADGSGGVAAVQFATLTGVSGTIVSAEFLII